MSEQPVEDPVQHASSTLTGYGYAALAVADLLGQARLRQTHTALSQEQHSSRSERLVPATRLAEAQARWAPLLDPDLRSRLTPGDLAAAQRAAGTWRAHRNATSARSAFAAAAPADRPRLLPGTATAIGRGPAALPAVATARSALLAASPGPAVRQAASSAATPLGAVPIPASAGGTREARPLAALPAGTTRTPAVRR